MEISFMEQAVIETWRQAPHDVAALFWIAFFQVNGGDSTLASFRHALRIPQRSPFVRCFQPVDR